MNSCKSIVDTIVGRLLEIGTEPHWVSRVHNHDSKKPLLVLCWLFHKFRQFCEGFEISLKAAIC